MDNFSNRTIKGYELLERVGEGSFGAVYRAYQPSVGREVSIKVILPQHANIPDFIRRFEVEAQLIASLEHPHIVPLYDYWRDVEGAFLVTRWLPDTLANTIRRKSWSVEAAVRLLEQIAGALSVAHRDGVVHRDVKPDNILLDEDDNAYLADFGIAKDLSLSATTEDGKLVRSLAYLTPEQIRGEPVSARTDIYSLGMVLYEILTGEQPYPRSSTSAELLQEQLNTPLPPLTSRRPTLPAALNEVLQTATAKDPSHRYASVLRFASALRAAIPTIQRRPHQPLPDPLTERELNILRLMVADLSNAEIAQQLHLASETVKWYARQVYSKLDVHSRHQAIERASQLNLLSTPAQLAVQDRTAVLPGTEPVNLIPSEPELTFGEPAVVNPYKGLRAFQEADATHFFGRAALIERLLARLTEKGDGARFLVVVGPSGSGKSSVIKAGLVPALRHGALPQSARWFIIDMMPGTHPLEELEVALLRIAVKPMPDLLRQLMEDRRGLVRAVRHILPPDQEVELLLVIDQFEELFTLVEDEAVRTHFIDNLLSAVTDLRSRIRLVLTLRADFYDRPLRYPRLAELVRSHTEAVVPLNADELERAIAGPAERVGRALELELVATIVHDIGEQPGTLPLLQYALTELFDRCRGRTLTLTDYQGSGGIKQALARRAASLYDELDAVGQAVVRQLFLRLISLNEGGEDTRRRVLLSEITSITDESAWGVGLIQPINDVLNAFGQYCLLTFDRDPVTRGPTVEIAHEALIQAWAQLREWLTDSREMLRLHRRLMSAAAEWVATRRDPSFLAAGTRLAQFEALASEGNLALNDSEMAYIRASSAAREIQQAEEAMRRKRELELARRAANRLRYLVAMLLLAMVAAFVLTGTAVSQQQLAVNNAATATIAQGQALDGAATLSVIVNGLAQSESHRLGLEAASLLKQNPGNAELAALLSVRAMKLVYVSEAELPLKQASSLLIEQIPAVGDVITFTGHKAGVNSVAFSPDGRYALTGSVDDTARLWNVVSGQEVLTFKGHTDMVTSAIFSPDGRYTLTGSKDATARLWDVATGQQVRIFQTTDWWIRRVAFSTDGKSILTAGGLGGQGTVRLWDVATGRQIRIILNLRNSPDVAFSPDAKYILTNADASSLLLLDARSAQEVRTIPSNVNVSSVAFSPDARFILTGSASDDAARVWDAQSGELLRSFAAGSRYVTSAAFSPDGKFVLTGNQDNTARLWDMTTGKQLRVFIGHTAGITSVAFSPDGRYILTGSDDGTAALWNTDVRAAIALACARLSRDFTSAERVQYSIGDDEPTCPKFATSETQNSPKFATWTLVPTATIPAWTALPSLPASPTPIAPGWSTIGP